MLDIDYAAASSAEPDRWIHSSAGGPTEEPRVLLGPASLGRAETLTEWRITKYRYSSNQCVVSKVMIWVNEDHIDGSLGHAIAG